MTAYTVLVFRWERTWQVRDLCWVVVAMVIALQFQILSVFGLLLLFFPPLVHGDERRLRQAAAAALVCALAYFLIDRWNGSFYFERAEEFGERISQGATVALSYEGISATVLLAGAIIACIVSWFASAAARTTISRVAVLCLLILAAAAQLTFNYHVAALAYLSALVIARRDSNALSPKLLLPLGFGVVIGLCHWLLIHRMGVETPRLILGGLTGRPSVWAYLNFAKLSYFAAAVAAAGVAYALVSIARQRKIADYWWLFVLTVWIPLLVIGLFQWYPAPRYTIGCFLSLLVCAFATLQGAMGALTRTRTVHANLLQNAAASIAVLLAINPMALAKTVNSGYDTHPDHKGAAEFVKARALSPYDRVLAEDVLMQTYYLKHVDYWLIARRVAAPFVENVNGRYVDGYTHTPVIGSGAELENLAKRHDRGALYVITSAEEGAGEDRYIEGEGIYEVLRNGSFEKVFVGRDGKTFVWMKAPRDEQSEPTQELVPR
jgi:hypothetical protein